MTIDEQIKILESNSEFERKEGDLQGCLNFKQLAEWLKDYKRLKEQEPCKDAVSREAVMHILDEVGGDFDSPREAVVPIDYIADMVSDLPSVSPQPCEDAISRQVVLDGLASIAKAKAKSDAQKSLMGRVMFFVESLSPVTPQPKTGRCKDCKYFEYDSVAKVNGIPLIVAHEICKRWGDGCKSSEDGYCFLFEPKTQEVEK